MNPITLNYLTQYRLEKDPIKKEKFGVALQQDTSFSRIKMKISLQDMHLIF
jgi:hypothetical protein